RHGPPCAGCETTESRENDQRRLPIHPSTKAPGMQCVFIPQPSQFWKVPKDRTVTSIGNVTHRTCKYSQLLWLRDGSRRIVMEAGESVSDEREGLHSCHLYVGCGTRILSSL